MLEKEFKYYLDNQKQLIKKYNGKFIVIVGEEVVNSYDSEQEAYFESLKAHKEGTFLIQFCEPGEESYSQTYHSRVVFN